MRKFNSLSKRLLIAVDEFAQLSLDNLDAFILSAGSTSLLKKNLNLSGNQYKSAFQGLARNGYIDKINENQFLITPKGRGKIRRIKIEEADWFMDSWDGNWRIVTFDVPEAKRKERDTLRLVLKNKGFIGIQNSVFIAPFADFELLDELRKDLKIEKYVSFFLAKSDSRDDDTNLKKKFNLK